MSKEPPEELANRLESRIELLAWILIGSSLLVARLLPGDPNELNQFFIAIYALSGILLVYFRWLRPRYGNRTWLPTLFSISVIAFMIYVDWISSWDEVMQMVFVLVYAVVGMRLGGRVVFFLALLPWIFNVALAERRGDLSLELFLLYTTEFLVYVLAGMISASLAGVFRLQAEKEAAQNKNLSLLLEVSRATSSLNLAESMPQLAQAVVEGLAVTCCRIELLDESGEGLIAVAVYPRQEGQDHCTMDEVHSSLEKLQLKEKAISSGLPVLARQDDEMNSTLDKEAVQALFSRVSSAYIVPIVFERQVLGLITAAEARRWLRAPISHEKQELLQAIASQVAAMVHNARQTHTAYRQLGRMQVINEVAQAIASTIELDDLLNLIYQQIQRVILAETYYVVLVGEDENSLDLRVMFDEGVSYPPMQLPLEGSLSGLVIRRRQPVLLRDLPQEIQGLPVQGIRVGDPRLSESWIGVPILFGEECLGVLAVASYRKHAFDNDDLAMLNTIASQAAMALDNARRHAEAVEQSRLDSLTQVFNHGYFLKRLEEEIENAKANGSPITLIMLDIDYFKACNDAFGHLVGDEVLQLIVGAICAHVKRSDLVGRWGGEEFCIALLGVEPDQALKIAERIRSTLAEMTLQGKDGELYPKPTVSQGIAVFPHHADSAISLVDMADRALYKAKAAGRDQISIFMAEGANILNQDQARRE